MKVADAHCDTLTKYPDNPLHSDTADWSVDKFNQSNGILQYFAIFTPPQYSGDSALRFVFESLSNFVVKCRGEVSWLKSPEDFNESKINILLSIEGAGPIINNINNLHGFYEMGVRAMGLTWNHRNYIGDGIDTDYGLTNFGIDVIKEMERISMIIDVSHLNEAGFNDVVAHTSKPFIASHSNARAVCNHKRNLNDNQIQEIINRGGFIGLNFYNDFIATDNHIIGFYKHVEHFLKLGAENVLGMGADYDGIPIAVYKDAASYSEIYEHLLNEMKLDLVTVDKIMYKNLVDSTLKLL